MTMKKLKDFCPNGFKNATPEQIHNLHKYYIKIISQLAKDNKELKKRINNLSERTTDIEWSSHPLV